jgi:nucleoside-diphosphate-sugar epimerase
VCVNIAGGSEITLSDLIALVGDVAAVGVKVDEQAAQPGDTMRNGGAIERAFSMLGWEPRVSLVEGVERQLDWHRTRV